MSVWEYIIGAVLIVFSLVIIAIVLLQEGRQANLGAIAGAADSFMEKGRRGHWMRPWQSGRSILPSPSLCWCSSRCC